jgi:prevent-host-death family protein
MMKRYNLNEAKTHLSALVDAVQDGSEIEITVYGKPKAKLMGVRTPQKVILGFRPIEFTSDLLEPTDPSISALFLDP